MEVKISVPNNEAIRDSLEVAVKELGKQHVKAKLEGGITACELIWNCRENGVIDAKRVKELYEELRKQMEGL